MSRPKVLAYTLVVRHPDTDAPTALLVGKRLPAWAKGLVDPGNLVDDVDEADEDESPAGATGYGAMKVAELKAEIGSRNEGRDEADLIPLDGKQADLVAALEADDALSA